MYKRQALSKFKQDSGIEEGPNLLFVSRIKPRNQLQTLLDVLKSVKKSYSSATASIVGAHGDEQKRIARIASEMGLSQSVFFPGAIYDEMKLAPWFLSATVFFYPSQIGLSLFHAFGYGLPVVAGVHFRDRNPEIEALIHSENGFLFYQEDPEQATEQVLRIIENPNLHMALSRGASETVANKFNIKTMSRYYKDAILFSARKRGLVLD